VRSAGHIGCALAFVFLLSACGGPQPLGPTPLDEGVIIFMNAGFRGTSQQVGTDVADLTRVEGPCALSDSGTGTWNDCMSSIRLLPGWGARLYGDKNFQGAVLEVSDDIPDLARISGDCSGSYDDCISSIRVFRR
jgi:hypothetical protein